MGIPGRPRAPDSAPRGDMDRMASSMKQVPNPLPKVLSRRGVGAGMEAAERESFERTQTVSINKAINTQVVAVKEKHARTCILGTHHEKGAQTFWSVVNRLPLSSNAVLCWKFCHVFHKLLRDGHPNVLKDSLRYKSELSDMSRMWGHLSEGYGQLCSIYLKLLRTKMEYHTKNPRFPGNLHMSDRQLEEAGESDVNNFFQLTVEMFDYLECELNLFQTVFNSLDMSRSVSVTTAGQCRLAPLIQVILDCSHLYDYAVKLLFKLHSCEYSGLDLWKLLAARPSLERGSSPCPGALGFLLRFQKARGAPSCVDNKRWGPSLAVRRDAPSLP